MSFLKTRVILSEQLHWQPSEIDNMFYWEYEISIEEYQKILKERKEQQEEQQGSQPGTGDISKMGSNMMRQAQSGFKMPSMPSFSMPKL